MRPSGRKNKFHPADLRGRPAEDQQGAWAPRSAGPPPPKVLSQLSHMQTVPRKHLGAAVTLSKHTSAATDFRLPESLILIPRVHIKNITAAVSGTLLTDEMRQAAGRSDMGDRGNAAMGARPGDAGQHPIGGQRSCPASRRQRSGGPVTGSA